MGLQQVQELCSVGNINVCENKNDFQAGRLRFFSNEWKKLTSDKNILDIVQHSHIDFIDGIPSVQNKNSIRFSKFNDKETMVIESEVMNLLKMNVIEKVQSCENEFISPIFVRPKKNGEYRMILNLKELNKNVQYHHFKMDTFATALNLIKQNSFIASVDLRHA